MKKILLILVALFIVQATVLADEIIDSKGNIAPCKVTSVSDGLIHYEIDGCVYSIHRTIKDPVFGDYVDYRKKIYKNGKFFGIEIERIIGYVSCKNFGGVIVKTPDDIIEIPWYRVVNVGIYKPN